MPKELFGRTKEKMEFAYANALERNVVAPVVFVLDVRDDIARWVAERFTTAKEADIAAQVTRGAGQDTRPLLTVALPQDQAHEAVAKLDPKAGEHLKGTPVPHGEFVAVAVADGKLAISSFKVP